MVKATAEELTEDEKKALRGSKFAPLPSLPPPRSQPRLAHPGGPLTTNKAAALAKFLERKLQDPNGLSSINPNLVERAVLDAKRTVFTTKRGASNSGVTIKHVSSFGDSDSEELPQQEDNVGNYEPKKLKKTTKQKKKKSEKKKKKKKKQQIMEDSGYALVKKPKKKKLKIVAG